MKRPSPLDSPRDFRINEMFFSTTDRKGVITSGNDVFVRVSGYAREKLVGTAHNIIRHPAMPRVVFRIVWDRLLAGQPVAGLVKNLASDGRYYWVVAFLMPLREGFLSIRFKPSSGLLPVVENLYGEMCRVEQAAAAAGQDGAAAMKAAEAVALTALQGLGLDSYEAFMRVLLHDELKSRDAQLEAERLALFPAQLGEPAERDPLWQSLAAIHASGRRAYAEINTLYAQLDRFVALNQELHDKSAFVLGLTQEFRYIAFNAALRSARLGEEGRSLSVIADYLTGSSSDTTRSVTAMMTQIDTASTRLRGIIFDLAAARLQIEMVLVFVAELAANRSAGTEGELQRTMISSLQDAFADTVERAMGELEALTKELRALSDVSEEMRRLVLSLQVAQVGGLVEACRLRDDDSFMVMFGELRQGVTKTKDALTDVDDASQQLTALATQAPAIARVIGQSVTEMSQAIDALTTVAAKAGPRRTAPAGHARAVPQAEPQSVAA